MTDEQRAESRKLVDRLKMATGDRALQLLVGLLIAKGVITLEEWVSVVDTAASIQRKSQDDIDKILGEMRYSGPRV